MPETNQEINVFLTKETRYYRIYERKDFFNVCMVCEWGSIQNRKPTGRKMYIVDEAQERAELLKTLLKKRINRGYLIQGEWNYEF